MKAAAQQAGKACKPSGQDYHTFLIFFHTKQANAETLKIFN